MENAKKMILVDPVRASQLYRPTIGDKKLSNLDENITKLLRSNLPADEKAKRYASSLKQLKYYDKPVVAKMTQTTTYWNQFNRYYVEKQNVC
jgi:hypothetical protein